MTHMKSACTSALSSPKQIPSAPVTGFVVGGKSVVCVQVILNGRTLLLFWPFTVTLYQAWWAGCLGIRAEQGLQGREWGKVLMQQGMPVSIAGNGNGNGSKEQRAKSKEQDQNSRKNPFTSRTYVHYCLSLLGIPPCHLRRKESARPAQS